MILRKNSLLLATAGLLALAAPAGAEEADYLSRSDFVEMTTGDAVKSNLAIAHPTPWPSYVNDTNIKTPARQGMSALEQMFKRYEGGQNKTPTTVINVGGQ